MEDISKRCKVVVLNGGRLDFDKKLDFSDLSAIADVTKYDDSTPMTSEILARVAGHDVVITKEITVPSEVLALFPSSVKLICEAGTGYNNHDCALARQKGISVCNVPEYSTDAVAHLVITFILNISCSLIPQTRWIAQGRRDNFTDKGLQHPHFELDGMTLGLIGGSGCIGRAVTKLALALGMRVIISTRGLTPRSDLHPDVKVTTSMKELLHCSDFVSVHCPLNAETTSLIDAAALKLMKPSAFIINTARGGIIAETDLICALRCGIIAGAALDVQNVEPPGPDNPLYTMDNVTLTPHIGWKRLQTRQRLIHLVAQNISSFLRGKPVNVVN